MKTENRQRELAFLHYLNALDSGDSEAIGHFLELAEQDERLEQMMLDYHEKDQKVEEAPEPPIKTIVPFKLKREHTRRMIQVAGLSSVAAFVLITVGMIGLILGLRQNNTLIADSQLCTVTLANADKTVHLIGGSDIERPLHVGVNNPFTVYLDTGEASEGYQVNFEGLRAVMSYDDLKVSGDCSDYRAVTVYAQGACTVDMQHVRFPFSGSDNYSNVPPYNYYDNSTSNVKLFSETVAVLDHMVDEDYPIVDDRFVGRISKWLVDVSEGCENYPLLYVPPRFEENLLNDVNRASTFKLDVDKIRVREQRFENGIMLYVEAIDEVWVLYYDTDGIQRWTIYDAKWIQRNNIFKSWLEVPEGLLAPEEGMFKAIWQILIATPEEAQADNFVPTRRLGDQIGWGISEPVTYMANYTYPTSGGNVEDWYHHFIETSTGEVYEFYPDAQYYPNVDNAAWEIVGASNQRCTVSLANADNTVHLIGGDDIESPLHVGVNNPFTVYLDTGEASEGYQVNFEGLRAVIAFDDLLLEGDCSKESAVTIYPQGETGDACEIDLDPIDLPMSVNNLKQWLDTSIVLNQPIDNFYPIVTDTFTARLPVELVHLKGDCVNYPLLYLPPRNDNRLDESNGEVQYHLQVDSLQVHEQQFEDGIMFYIEAVDEVWVAYRYETTRHWMYVSGIGAEKYEGFPPRQRKAPEGFFVPEYDMFRNIWLYFGGNYSDNNVFYTIENLSGWAVSEPVNYTATYETVSQYGHYANSHILESSTGERYQFYEVSRSWRIVNDEEK